MSPVWCITENENGYKKYELKLPINSVIKPPINVNDIILYDIRTFVYITITFILKGIFCKTKKNAKKSAAINACIKLYEIGALDEYLFPTNIKHKTVFSNLKWFPHWIEKDNEADKLRLEPGTSQMNRIIEIEVNCSILFSVKY